MGTLERRKFLQSSLALSGLPFLGLQGQTANPHIIQQPGSRFKISLNAYSFNASLRSGQTRLEAVIEFCASQGFDAADLTGYYFPGYPEVPKDEYIYQLKRIAHHAGISISGT